MALTAQSITPEVTEVSIMGQQASVRRFPPALQILVPVSLEVQQKLQQTVLKHFQQGKTLDVICWELYNTALALGYHATIGVQEVSSNSMPSFAGQTVLSALLLVDLQPIDGVGG